MTKEMGIGAQIALGIIKTAMCVYDVITFPFYFLVQQPWEHWKKVSAVYAKQIREDDPYSPIVRVPKNITVPFEGVRTMSELFRLAVQKHGNRPCLGVREVFGEEEEQQADGKIFKKLVLGEYRWQSYIDIDHRVDNLTKGLLAVGIRPRQNVVIFADTRIEWMLTALACFRNNIPIVTVYSTLGPEGITHAINETEVTHVVTSVDLLPTLKKAIHNLPTVNTVIFMESFKTVNIDFPENVKLIPFSQVEKLGETSDPGLTGEVPGPEDLAIIMYTSGSTGVPKGVMIAHKSLLVTAKGFTPGFYTESMRMACSDDDSCNTSRANYDPRHIISVWLTKLLRVMITHKNTITTTHGFAAVCPEVLYNDLYIAFLPLAHVLELSAESFFMCHGIPIGYSSPHTLTDKSTAVRRGCQGDATILKPTIIAAVPLIMDRIRKSVIEVAEAKGPFAKALFMYCIKYKQFWMSKGFNTPVMNNIMFKKIKGLVGGRVRLVACGGAPLSPDTHSFIRAVLDTRMIQGYGLTETAAGATIMDLDDPTSGRVGPPLSGIYIKLVDWEEGGYKVTDKPSPRGEIVVGGDNISKGYYKNEALTNESYRTEDGIRWFFTGDIGQLEKDGSIRIIDRRKDLVKLQFGEYISLGKVESELKTCPIVENICVYGNSFHTYLVALVAPNPKQLHILATALGKGNLSFPELCKDPAIASGVLKLLREHAIKCKLQRTEIPIKVSLCQEEWAPSSGLVTAAFKLRRKDIEKFYQKEISMMYNTEDANGQSKST